MLPPALSTSEIALRLAHIPGWSFIDSRLHRELTFHTFRDAIKFMNGAAEISEILNHHPNWSNVYNRVTIDLWTHEVGGVSERDFAWAKEVEALCLVALS